MISSFFTGFFLGFSLILAIGSQNTFVLRQGIIGSHIFYVALFCAVSDVILIGVGIAGQAASGESGTIINIKDAYLDDRFNSR